MTKPSENKPLLAWELPANIHFPPAAVWLSSVSTAVTSCLIWLRSLLWSLKSEPPKISKKLSKQCREASIYSVLNRTTLFPVHYWYWTYLDIKACLIFWWCLCHNKTPLQKQKHHYKTEWVSRKKIKIQGNHNAWIKHVFFWYDWSAFSPTPCPKRTRSLIFQASAYKRSVQSAQQKPQQRPQVFCGKWC